MSTDWVTKLAAPQGISKVEAVEYARLQGSIIADAKEHQASKSYIFELSQIEKLSVALEKEVSEYSDKIENQKIEILKLANKIPTDPHQAALWQLKLAGKMKKEFIIDDLIIIFLQNDGERLVKQNPHLSDEDVKSLVNQLTNYLINSTESDHLKALSKKSLEVLKEKGQEESAWLELNSLLREKRSYLPEKEQAMLVFEYYRGFRLRENNVKTIRSMILGEPQANKNIVNQLIMGSGKTKVILPLLAFLNSRGDNVPIILAPDQLFETNLEDMRALSGEILNQEIETIIVKKETQLSVEDMKEILRTFERVKTRRSYCLVNQTTVSTLHLHYKEIIANLPNDSEKYILIKQIMNTFANEGDLIIDEVDMVLDCLKEMNFSRGEWKNVDQTTQMALYNTFKALVKDPLFSMNFLN